eukprot:gene21449-biopygen23634
MSGVGAPAARPRTHSAGGYPYAWRRRPLPALRPHMSGVGAPAIRPRPMADRLTCSAGASLTPIPRTNAFRWRNGRQ